MRIPTQIVLALLAPLQMTTHVARLRQCHRLDRRDFDDVHALAHYIWHRFDVGLTYHQIVKKLRAMGRSRHCIALLEVTGVQRVVPVHNPDRLYGPGR